LAYINSISLGILAKFFKEKNFWFLEVLKQVFKSVWGFNSSIFIVLGFWKNQRKEYFGRFVLVFILYLLEGFSQVIFFVASFPNT